ncbi:hypothetical protein [Lignipirellula cremea]|uniref:Uncharacterized protein n=1 Tax=Lignipirellula cremea TaxID=2528010 RepID=A0A518DY24_9BACT|nr:hypothetical protein [Lignipirellula cremea]QDU96749.1 hypothetical protein Pla8534_45700 [Lignipirellula cremea]
MSNPFDPMATANYAANLAFSQARFQKMYPEFFRWFGRKTPYDGRPLRQWMDRFSQHLFYGNPQAAVVVSQNPLLVAAYTEELDCVAMLKFPDITGITAPLSVGDRLLTVNTYQEYAKVVSDLQPGPRGRESWQNFKPILADLFSDDQARITYLKSKITEAQWIYAQQLGERYLVEKPGHVRDGCPLSCMFPGTPQRLWPNFHAREIPPNFSASLGALEFLRRDKQGRQVDFDTVTVLLDAVGIHPEIYERTVDFKFHYELQQDQYFHTEINGVRFAITKAKAHAYDNVGLAFDQERHGFTFKNLKAPS